MIKGLLSVEARYFEDLHRLTSVVFRPSLVSEYPQLFHRGNWSNLGIMTEGRHVVSHVGMTIQDASLFGCPIRVACIGAVCTDPDHRQRGYASQLFANAIEKARKNEVDLMITSGGRSIYLKAGSAPVGAGHRFTAPFDLSAREQLGIRVRRVEHDALDVLAALYDREPVRFQRTRVTYERAFDCRFVMNRSADFLVLEKGKIPLAYTVVQKPNHDQDCLQIVEYAGDRLVLREALPLLAKRYRCLSATLYVPSWDSAFCGLLKSWRVKATRAHTSGVYLVVNFVQLMERLRPLFKRLDGEDSDTVRFSETKRGFTFQAGSSTHVVKDRANLARFLWGTTETSLKSTAKGTLGKHLESILPLPELWYGINYV